MPLLSAAQPSLGPQVTEQLDVVHGGDLCPVLTDAWLVGTFPQQLYSCMNHVTHTGMGSAHLEELEVGMRGDVIYSGCT